jgi:hypothetical protein
VKARHLNQWQRCEGTPSQRSQKFDDQHIRLRKMCVFAGGSGHGHDCSG